MIEKLIEKLKIEAFLTVVEHEEGEDCDMWVLTDGKNKAVIRYIAPYFYIEMHNVAGKSYKLGLAREEDGLDRVVDYISKEFDRLYLELEKRRDSE